MSWGQRRLRSIALPTHAGQAIDPSAVSLQTTSTFHAGDPVFIRLTDFDRNLDPTVRDTVDLRVTTSQGDEEVLRLQETGPDTGVFVGVVQSTPLGGPVVSFDCRLAVGANTTLAVQYVDALYPPDTSQVTALFDPYGFVFDSSSGLPVNGAVVTLVSVATGHPAAVFGDDGLSTYPSTVTSGLVAKDSSGQAYAIAAGGFRFPLLLPGDYLIRITPPAGYTSPSTVPTSTLITLPAIARNAGVRRNVQD